jgi:type IV secretory pathway VirJ component
MRNAFLRIVVPVLLVTLGFGQTPAPSSNTEQASIKGCLGGSDGNYTVAEDGTTQSFKITSSTVDLKPHLGHDVEVIAQKATVATSSGSSESSVVVTGLNMISEHCATATASAPAATISTTPAVNDTAVTATAGTPAAADPTPTTTARMPAETASAPMAASASAPESTKHLPDTATPLPILALLGLSLLATGLLSWRSRTY